MPVRKSSPQDYEIIYKIAVPSWNEAYKNILSVEQMEYMLDLMYSREAITEQMALQNHQFLLAEEDGEYLGFASYQVNYLSGATKLHKLYMLPEAQGKGIGRQLLTAIENAALQNNNDTILVNVNRYNTAVTFYEKTGFVKVREEDIAIGNGYLMEDFVMAKQL
jgi:GNAT superfamily N-acetyltransferase